MLKVILVDDEPFNLQGLSVLIDWNSLGFEVSATFSNGKEALDYLRKNEVNLVITDIKMPVMNGIELLRAMREQRVTQADCIILSGYSEFEYAQQAIQYNCMGYMLKPVDKFELMSLLRRVSEKHVQYEENEDEKENLESAYLARNVISLLVGKFDEENIKYVSNHMTVSDNVRFIDMEFGTDDMENDEENNIKIMQRKVYQAGREILKEDKTHLIFDVSRDEDSYDIAMVFCDCMASDRGYTEEGFFEWFHNELQKKTNVPIKMYVGKGVTGIRNISKSYYTVRILKSSEAFRDHKDINYYDDMASVNQAGVVLCKPCLDNLISIIEKNEKEKIKDSVEDLYREMRGLGLTSETLNLNINYFLFQLIHLATQQDDEVNQEEILHFISESTFHEGVMRGSSEHMTSFAGEYADYLSQLRKNLSGGVLQDIEKEIHNNYAENLSLRELGKKYYLNSSYLGQVFRKKYGQSFKDYLTMYRINEAAGLLLKTDKKINIIAEEVGYKDSDYFIRKFIEIKGCTPSKYRKNNKEM